ncbi:DUF6427 family protein [Labilibaculum sp.]|uniref:DUF6427 family protein n=1 Tax=Labilibaculum sp. TaxID=2060723 RepID=UPI0035677E3A
MLLKTLKGRHPISLVFVPIIIVLLSLDSFFRPMILTSGNKQMPLYDLLLYVSGENSLILNLIACIVLVVMAFGMVRLNEEHVFIRQRTDLPAFVYAFIATGCLSTGSGMHPSLLAAFFLFLAVDRIFKIYQGTATISGSFDAGFLVGIASLFYLFASVYVFWLWMALAVLGYLRAKEIFASIIGFILPIFCVLFWYIWKGSLFGFFETVSQIFQYKNELQHASVFQYLYWGILGVLVLLSSLYMLTVYEEKKVSSRKYFIVLLSFFLLSAICFIFFRGAGVEQYFISIIPVTYIISHYFVLQKHSWIGEVLFYILIVSSILIHFLR